jgi:hypothetical protein
MTNDNRSWGYTRIHGALRNVDIEVGRGYDPSSSQRSSDRAGANPRASHLVVGVSQNALARSRRDRLLQIAAKTGSGSIDPRANQMRCLGPFANLKATYVAL